MNVLEERRHRVLSAPLLENSPFAKQLELEERAVNDGITRYWQTVNDVVARGDGSSLKPAEQMIAAWYPKLHRSFLRIQRALRAGHGDTGAGEWGPAILCVPADRMASLTLQIALNECMMDPTGVKMNHVAHQVGSAILAEIQWEKIGEVDGEAKKKLARKRGLRLNQLSPAMIHAWARKNMSDEVYGRATAYSVGTRLCVNLVTELDLNGEPAFVFQSRYIKAGQKPNMLVLHKSAWKWIAEAHELRQALRPRYLPMIVPPCPWMVDPNVHGKAFSKCVPGGYIGIRTPFMSHCSKKQRERMDMADLQPEFDAVNALGLTGWERNETVYNTARQLWNEGGGVVGLPSANDIPELPRLADDEWADPLRKAAWKHQRSQWHAENAKLRADRMTFLRKMDTADEFGQQAFYLPHQMDFRGRCYPIPPTWNHHQDDVSRGMLLFNQGADPTSDEAVRWLLIHTASVYGHDKWTFADRVTWARDHMKKIVTTGMDPMGDDWWHQADKPWQFLAACVAWAYPDVAARLPIQMDGSCNGLQHYAALGRDEDGARSVNLFDCEVPADVYTHVLVRVRETVQVDAAAGMEEAVAVLPLLSRVLVKQPVMTTVYGVTKMGAKMQVSSQLSAISDKDVRRKVAYYTSKIVMQSIGEVMVGASKIMQWLKEVAAIVSRSGNRVAWNTPMGLPVVQSYCKGHIKRIQTAIGRISVGIYSDAQPVEVDRQIRSFAPNFIHSLDGCHMKMTAVAMHARGLPFGMVHDSYWSRAADAGYLAVALREKFVELHAAPVLENIKAQIEWETGLTLPELPPPGRFDLNNVLTARYFFH